MAMLASRMNFHASSQEALWWILLVCHGQNKPLLIIGGVMTEFEKQKIKKNSKTTAWKLQWNRQLKDRISMWYEARKTSDDHTFWQMWVQETVTVDQKERVSEIQRLIEALIRKGEMKRIQMGRKKKSNRWKLLNNRKSKEQVWNCYAGYFFKLSVIEQRMVCDAGQ